MVNPSKRYFVHLLPGSELSLAQIGKTLTSTMHSRERTYFDEDGEPKSISLRTKFGAVNITEETLLGTAKVEMLKEGTDIDGKYGAIRDAFEARFYLRIKGKPYVTILSSSSSVARALSRVVNSMIFEGQRVLPRLVLSDGQLIKFCELNKYTMKGQISGTRMTGIDTLGTWGSNIEKPPQFEMMKKWLTERKAVKLLLHDYRWTIWISRKSGALSCLDEHEPMEFVDFIRDKILTLGI